MISLYKAESASEQDETNLAFWLATWVRKMGPSPPPPPLGFSVLVRQEKGLFLAIYNKINPLLTKFVLSWRLDIGHILFSIFFLPQLHLSPLKHKKQLGQYPAILRPLNLTLGQ